VRRESGTVSDLRDIYFNEDRLLMTLLKAEYRLQELLLQPFETELEVNCRHFHCDHPLHAGCHCDNAAARIVLTHLCTSFSPDGGDNADRTAAVAQSEGQF
jgi:hypothetical protein